MKTGNDLNQFIKQEVIIKAKENIKQISGVSFGLDRGCNYKNDIFVSFGCNTEHVTGTDCMCADVLDQDNLKDVEINLNLAEIIAFYVASLVGIDNVYRG